MNEQNHKDEKSQLQKQIKSLKSKIEKLNHELELEHNKYTEKIRENSRKLIKMKEDLSKKQSHNDRLHSNNVKLIQEKRKLQEKINKISINKKKRINDLEQN
eukprot:UN27104